jgi:hypothetical protein
MARPLLERAIMRIAPRALSALLLVTGCQIGAGPYDWPEMLDCDFCSGESVCLDGGCEPAFPREYRLQVKRAVMPKHPSQDQFCWDDLPCGLPEPRLMVYLNEQQIAAYSGGDDEYTVFGGTFDMMIPPNSSLVVMAVDDDPTPKPDQVGIACYFAPLEGKHVRSGVLSCTDNGGAIEASIVLPHDEPLPEVPPPPPLPPVQ